MNSTAPAVCSSRILLLVLTAVLVAGCGGSDDASDDASTLRMVTVNWIEGLAMTYVQQQILEDSLGADVSVREVSGGGLAFAAVASGDADVFNEAWLPTTHQQPWEAHKSDLRTLGYTYRGTSVGLVVPTYVEADSVPDLRRLHDALDGTIHGIEAGAAINEQTRRTLKRYGLDDAFSVTAASGPATWSALERAIDTREPFVAVGWTPHWKWNAFDLRYLNGATTGQNVDIWGASEDIYTVIGTGVLDRVSKPVACFLKTFEASDEQIGSLMLAFTDRGGQSEAEVARTWMRDHPDDVRQWLQDTRTCVASDTPVRPLGAGR